MTNTTNITQLREKLEKLDSERLFHEGSSPHGEMAYSQLASFAIENLPTIIRALRVAEAAEATKIDLKCAEDVVAPARQIRDELAGLVKFNKEITLSAEVLREWHEWLDTSIRRKDFFFIGDALQPQEREE